MGSLLKLVDGEILTIREEHDEEPGCETCNYGATYSQDFYVETTQGIICVDTTGNYSFPFSHDELFKIFLPNVELIQSMKIKEFYAWLIDKLSNSNKSRTFSHRFIPNTHLVKKR